MVESNGFKTIDTKAPLWPSGVHSLVSPTLAISLFGVSDSRALDNRVYDNGRGGIGIMDNGANDPGTITQSHSAPLVGSSNDIMVAIRNEKLIDNHVTKNDISHIEAPSTTGIIIFAASAAKLPPKTSPAENVNTVLSGNTESGQVYQIWTSGLNQTSCLSK